MIGASDFLLLKVWTAPGIIFLFEPMFTLSHVSMRQVIWLRQRNRSASKGRPLKRVESSHLHKMIKFECSMHEGNRVSNNTRQSWNVVSVSHSEPWISRYRTSIYHSQISTSNNKSMTIEYRPAGEVCKLLSESKNFHVTREKYNIALRTKLKCSIMKLECCI